MMKKAHIVVCILILSICLASGCAESSLHKKSKQYSSERLQAVVDEYLQDKTNVLGTIVKVDFGGKESYEAAKGYFDLSRKTPINPKDKFIIGSITKIFTAVLVHQLIEKGKVQLQNPLIDYLSTEWVAILRDIPYGGEITVEHALSHRSGVADIIGEENFWREVLSNPTRRWTPIEVLKRVQQKGKPSFKPGDRFEYCNTNYILLGALIENLSGASYKASLQNNIFKRIGLDNTFFSEETMDSNREGIAHGYQRVEDKLYDGQEINVGWDRAAGGIISTADDLIKFYRALSSGRLYGTKETYERMCRLVGYNESYGLGLEVNDDPDIGLYYGHAGSFCNTRAMLAHLPEHQITIVVCHTYDDFSTLAPRSLMKAVLEDMIQDGSADDTESTFEGLDILADSSNVIENEDVPARGDWNFDLKEVWNIASIDARPLAKKGNIHVYDDGKIYLIDQESAEIFVLDQDGNIVVSFGGYGEGPQFQYASEIYITSDHIHVWDMGNSGDRIKTFDKEGNFKSTFKLESGVTPKIFVNDNQYIAVQSESDIENRPTHEQLLLLSPEQKKGSLLGKIVADERLVVSTNVMRGRVHLLLDDVEIFPRLILHLSENMLYLGRSDRYLIKKVDLQGNEVLAFAVRGRKRTPLPEHYDEDRISEIKLVGGVEMPREMREELLAGFPKQQVLYTDITTNEQGLIYVFVPDVVNKGKQEIDIFSPEGKYLYRSIIELPGGLQKIGPFVLKGNFLYALVKSERGERKLVKYEIRNPEYSDRKRNNNS